MSIPHISSNIYNNGQNISPAQQGTPFNLDETGNLARHFLPAFDAQRSPLSLRDREVEAHARAEEPAARKRRREYDSPSKASAASAASEDARVAEMSFENPWDAMPLEKERIAETVSEKNLREQEFQNTVNTFSEVMRKAGSQTMGNRVLRYHFKQWYLLDHGKIPSDANIGRSLQDCRTTEDVLALNASRSKKIREMQANFSSSNEGQPQVERSPVPAQPLPLQNSNSREVMACGFLAGMAQEEQGGAARSDLQKQAQNLEGFTGNALQDIIRGHKFQMAILEKTYRNPALAAYFECWSLLDQGKPQANELSLIDNLGPSLLSCNTVENINMLHQFRVKKIKQANACLLASLKR